MRNANHLQAVAPFNPRPLLQSLVDKDIVVRLKWGETEYKGRLVSVDLYMNIQLANTEEFVNGISSGTLGQVLIRCNNVLWIGQADGVEAKANKDTAMSG
ncbi:small nuclear ribonucleo protein F [Lizonia empirigonia]|nr:small nuclear ribonucleo protein F [Lizonia empirigonia]